MSKIDILNLLHDDVKLKYADFYRRAEKIEGKSKHYFSVLAVYFAAIGIVLNIEEIYHFEPYSIVILALLLISILVLIVICVFMTIKALSIGNYETIDISQEYLDYYLKKDSEDSKERYVESINEIIGKNEVILKTKAKIVVGLENTIRIVTIIIAVSFLFVFLNLSISGLIESNTMSDDKQKNAGDKPPIRIVQELSQRDSLNKSSDSVVLGENTAKSDSSDNSESTDKK